MRKSVYAYSPFWGNPSVNNPWREPVDVILDSIVECSALIEQVDLLIQSGNPELQDDIDIGERLLIDCLALKDQLDADFNDMERRLGYPYSSPEQRSFWSELDESIPGDIFPDAIEYPSLSCGEAHILWFTTYILLSPLIDQLLFFLGRSQRNVSFTLWEVPTSPSSSEVEAPPTPSRGSEHLETFLDVAEHYADMICRSAKYMVQPETKALGAQIFLAPFSQATQFYHSQETIHKHRWCQSIFMVLPRLGFGIAPFLKDMIWPKYEAATKKSPSTSPRSQSSSSSST